VQGVVNCHLGYNTHISEITQMRNSPSFLLKETDVADIGEMHHLTFAPSI